LRKLVAQLRESGRAGGLPEHLNAGKGDVRTESAGRVFQSVADAERRSREELKAAKRSR